MKTLDELKQVIAEKHSGDNEQLEIIFSLHPRIMVEAPAGYGKTHTLISKIAYLLSINSLPGYKKILALTFSVNAAYKIKKDVENNLPELLGKDSNNLKRKIATTNYHGFCLRVLQKYGYLLADRIKDISILERLELTNRNINNYRMVSTLENLNKIIDFDTNIKNAFYLKNKANRKSFLEEMEVYNSIIINDLLEKNFITYNAIITLTIELFDKYPNIKSFYTNYYPYIIVDEYQDTNILNWYLLNKLITSKTKLLFLGDSLQRIYGFIGAIPNLIKKSLQLYGMKSITLNTNYRFENEILRSLDFNLREKHKNLEHTFSISDIENVIYETQNLKEEASTVLRLISNTREDEKNAILFKYSPQRDNNVGNIINSLDANKVDYFYAVFSEEDSKYKKFHGVCLKIFYKIINDNNYKTYTAKTTKITEMLYKALENDLTVQDNRTICSLFELLNIFFIKTKKHQNLDERYEIIEDVLRNNSLKHYIKYVDKRLIAVTIHGAKGLEWDNVIIPNLNKPNFCWNLCGKCTSNNCEVNNINGQSLNFKRVYREELSTFYVAVTRAKKQVFFTYSKQAYRFNDLEQANSICFINILQSKN